MHGRKQEMSRKTWIRPHAPANMYACLCIDIYASMVSKVKLTQGYWSSPKQIHRNHITFLEVPLEQKKIYILEVI